MLTDLEKIGEIPTYFAIKEILPLTKLERQNVIANWEKEAHNLYELNKLNHPHIVRFMNAFRRGNEGDQTHYLMFEWADGGSLRDLWRQLPQPEMTPTLVTELVEQLLGLADAICAAHNLDSKGTNFRHGDLKPDNILWFTNGTVLGRLKIGDWGLAKQHYFVTEKRTNKTSTMHGTLRYEPPEVKTGAGVLSRLYDIWAMGCIILEFIVWLLYGDDELKRFSLEVKGESSEDSPCYQLSYKGGKKTARVHDAAVRWMNHLEKDPACAEGTAMGDLLKLVREKLLVVELGQRHGSTEDLEGHQETNIAFKVTAPDENNLQPVAEGPCRALAIELLDALTQIAGTGVAGDAYWFTDLPPGTPRRGPRPLESSRPAGQGGGSPQFLSGQPIAKGNPKEQRPQPGLLAPQEKQNVRPAIAS